MGATDLDAVLERVDRIAPLIRERASESERLGNLVPDIVEALRGAGLFGMLIPADMGGLGLTIPQAIRVTEQVAALDASTGWTMIILAAGPLLARFLSPDAFQVICGSNPPGLVAGSLNPATARAERVDGGYLFSGTSTYLSGSAYAQWIIASAIVTENHEPVFTETGIEIRSGAFPIERARSLDNWHVTGMRATGSTDYEFAGVRVAAEWTFEPMRPRAVDGDVFSSIPIWAQLGSPLASCAVGAARNMIERFVEIAAAKVPAGNFSRMAERPPAQIALGEAEGLAQAARAVLHETVDRVWARGVAGEPFDNEALARQRLGVVTAVRLAAQSVDVLHDASGMSAVARDSVLERCWRDVHTITQHVVLSPARFETAGRVLLALDPGGPLI